MNGGLTQEQFHALYSELCKLENRMLEFQGSIHGVDLRSNKDPSPSDSGKKDPRVSDIPLFGDPEDYKNMKPEEKDKITNAMLNSHKGWVQTKKV